MGEVFPIGDHDVPQIPLTLTEAELFKANGMNTARAPFSLVFLAKDTRVLPQRLYRLEHNELGAVEIFLVPISLNPM